MEFLSRGNSDQDNDQRKDKDDIVEEEEEEGGEVEILGEEGDNGKIGSPGARELNRGDKGPQSNYSGNGGSRAVHMYLLGKACGDGEGEATSIPEEVLDFQNPSENDDGPYRYGEVFCEEKGDEREEINQSQASQEIDNKHTGDVQAPVKEKLLGGFFSSQEDRDHED